MRHDLTAPRRLHELALDRASRRVGDALQRLKMSKKSDITIEECDRLARAAVDGYREGLRLAQGARA